MSTQIFTIPSISGKSSTSFKKCSATLLSASYGQGRNQSMAQQLTKDGNILSLLLKSSPIGDMANTIWTFYLHFCKKSIHISLSPKFLNPGTFLFTSLMLSMIFMISSAAEYKFGISPLLRTLLTSSRKDSRIIYVSFNKKTVYFSSTPQLMNSFCLMSSLQALKS